MKDVYLAALVGHEDAPIGMETARVGAKEAIGGWRCGSDDASNFFP